MPGDTAAKVVQTKEPQHKDDFDEWLARIICFAFSVPPQWAVKVMNRATADNQSAQSAEEGLEPTKEWVKDLIDEIIAEEFSSPDLELHWLDEDADARQSEAALESRVKLGALTLNEMRGALGLDPYANAAADRPMVLTATGYVPIEAGMGAPSSSPAGLTRGSMLRGRSMDCRVEPGNDATLQKYNPDQPRVPAGNPDGGQWTSGRASGAPSEANSGSDPDNASRPVQYAALDTGTQIGAAGSENQAAPNPRYAMTTAHDETPMETGNQRVDETTEKLTNILVGIVDNLETWPGLTP